MNRLAIMSNGEKWYPVALILARIACPFSSNELVNQRNTWKARRRRRRFPEGGLGFSLSAVAVRPAIRGERFLPGAALRRLRRARRRRTGGDTLESVPDALHPAKRFQPREDRSEMDHRARRLLQLSAGGYRYRIRR